MTIPRQNSRWVDENGQPTREFYTWVRKISTPAEESSETLESLSNVSVSLPVDGQALTYNASLNQWLNTTPSGGGGLSDGDYGDITVSGGATALTIDAGAVSTSKMGGDVTAAGKALLDDADAAAQRATLGIDAAADARIAAASVNALSDVTVTAPSVGQVLKWNGSAWINDSDATGGGGGGNFVEAEVDFGSGKSDATVVITGQAGILTTSKVNAWIFPKATTDHTADEHWLETISVHAGNIVAGTGFTIYAKNTNTLNEPVEAYNRGGKGGKGTFLYGKYTVQASWG